MMISASSPTKDKTGKPRRGRPHRMIVTKDGQCNTRGKLSLLKCIAGIFVCLLVYRLLLTILTFCVEIWQFPHLPGPPLLQQDRSHVQILPGEHTAPPSSKVSATLLRTGIKKKIPSSEGGKPEWGGRAGDRRLNSSQEIPSMAANATSEPSSVNTTEVVVASASNNTAKSGFVKDGSDVTVTDESGSPGKMKTLPKAQTLSKPWMINETSRHPQEVHHIVFVKVHKAASTTMFSIFVKFALARHLNIMFPKQGNTLSQNGPKMLPLVHHPPSPPFLFDILCNHVIFNHTLIKPFFPPDTKHVAILREPFRQVKSAFSYYKTVYHRRYLRQVTSFEQFIQNQSLFEPSSAYQSFTNNRMSIDLGLHPHYLGDPTYVRAFIQHLRNVFDLVLIADRFDESVVLLKRRFHWTMKDIVYIRLNTLKRKAEPVKQLSADTMKAFQRFQLFDMAVYKHFLKVFNEKVAEEGQDFTEELTRFVATQKQIMKFCDRRNKSASHLVVPSSRWDKEFTIQKSECEILRVKELALNKWAKTVQLARLKKLLNDTEKN